MEVVTGGGITSVHPHIKLWHILGECQFFFALGNLYLLHGYLQFRTDRTAIAPKWCVICHYYRYAVFHFGLWLEFHSNERIEGHTTVLQVFLGLQELVFRFIQFYLHHQQILSVCESGFDPFADGLSQGRYGVAVVIGYADNLRTCHCIPILHIRL